MSIVLEFDECSKIAKMCLNNPEKRNALNYSMMLQLSEKITHLEQWQNGKAVIVYGKNGFFSSGIDLNYVRENINSKQSGLDVANIMLENLSRLKALPMISVAAISGQALGGGAEITSACDLRFMTKSAKIGYVHIKVGVTPGWSGATRLINICGYTKALDLFMSGRILSAEEAFNIGLCNQVFEDKANDSEIIEETIKILHKWHTIEP